MTRAVYILSVVVQKNSSFVEMMKEPMYFAAAICLKYFCHVGHTKTTENDVCQIV